MAKVAVIGCTHAGVFATSSILVAHPDWEIRSGDSQRKDFCLLGISFCEEHACGNQNKNE